MKEENKLNKQEAQGIVPLSVTGFEDEDVLNYLDEQGNRKSLIDVRRLKMSQGSEVVHLEDVKQGITISLQSHKENIKTLLPEGIKKFDEILSRRNKLTPTYFN